MSTGIWSWILFGNILLLIITQYYASFTQINYYTITPIAILYITKIISLTIFGIVSGLFAFIGMAMLEVLVIILSIIKIGRVQNDYQ